MQVHINAILRLRNKPLAPRSKLSHSFRRHPKPSRQQSQTKAVEEPISVCGGAPPGEQSHHSLADQPLASV
jgi:hypothetical protein